MSGITHFDTCVLAMRGRLGDFFDFFLFVLLAEANLAGLVSRKDLLGGCVKDCDDA